MNNIKIYKNFLNKKDFDIITENINSTIFPWNYRDGVNTFADGNNQLVHNFYKIRQTLILSPYFDILLPIINKINPFIIIRIKANLLLKTNKNIEHGFHTDYNSNENAKITTGIYYVNTNNGYTLFETGEKIISEANTYVEFNSNIKHTGSTQTDTSSRIVINFNYISGDKNFFGKI